jgi:hypothetical protein
MQHAHGTRVSTNNLVLGGTKKEHIMRGDCARQATRKHTNIFASPQISDGHGRRGRPSELVPGYRHIDRRRAIVIQNNALVPVG